MASEKQIEANRRNSQLSTGPRTETGKSISRMNAIQSGLHAESHIIRSEDPEALARLSAEYYDEFRPTTPRQRDLVDTIVHNQWLIRRLRLTEADLHAHHFQKRDDSFNEKYRSEVRQREHPLADAFDSLEKRLLRLQSRLNSLERSTRAALKELNELNSGTGDETSRSLGISLPVPELPLEESATSDPIGFVPSNVGQASWPVRDVEVPMSSQAAPPEDRAKAEAVTPAARIPDSRPQIPAERSEAPIGFVPSNTGAMIPSA